MNPHHAVLYKPNPLNILPNKQKTWGMANVRLLIKKNIGSKKKEPGKIHNIFIMSKSGQDINSNSST